MPEHKFTKTFKSNLAFEISTLLEEKNRIELLQIQTEYNLKVKKDGKEYNNLIDIAIISTDESEFRPSKVVGIEIEISSNQLQLESNFQKFKDYIFQGQKGNGNRKGALMHLISDRVNSSNRKLIEQLKYSYSTNMFAYDLYFFDIGDLRKPRIIAENLIDDWKFLLRLVALIEYVFDENIDRKNYCFY